MVIRPEQLRQHLELAVQAFGGDLRLPPGKAMPRAPIVQAPAAEPGQTVPPPSDIASGRPASEPRAVAFAAAPVRVPTGQPVANGQVQDRLALLRTEVLACTRCKLCHGRTKVVFGEGNPRARVLFIGEAPGINEDRTGRPFVGKAGELLDLIIGRAMGLARQDVFIANINKCRPPDNRPPEADEVAACLPYLRQQVEIIGPEVIVCLGRTAAQNLLGTTASTTALRGRELSYANIPVVVTWHPAYLLRDPSHKRETWDDIKRVNRMLGLPEVPLSAQS